jgi:hypothetical protein
MNKRIEEIRTKLEKGLDELRKDPLWAGDTHGQVMVNAYSHGFELIEYIETLERRVSEVAHTAVSAAQCDAAEIIGYGNALNVAEHEIRVLKHAIELIIADENMVCGAPQAKEIAKHAVAKASRQAEKELEETKS